MINYGKEKNACAAEKWGEAEKRFHMDRGYFRFNRRPCRPDSRYRHPDNGDEVRYAMTISRNTLLNFALGCFIFSTIVFAILFILK
jgi:hypothetical protein